MTSPRIIGLILIVIGVALLYFGYNASQSVRAQVQEGITGYFSNQTIWFLIGGIAGIVVGGAMALLSGRRAKE